MLSNSDSRRQVLSWALYDWANSAFATTVMAGFFPVFFSSYWSAQNSAAENTFKVGAINSISSLAVVFLAPVLGAIADQGSRRKKFLVFFAYMGALSTISLTVVARGEWQVAALLYVLGAIGFSGANTFYDALLVGVSPPRERDWVSALGFGLGYLGGGLLFALNVAMVRFPGFFGLHSSEQATRLSFVTVGLWWILFSVPLMLWVKEPDYGRKAVSGLQATRLGFLQLKSTFREVRRLRTVFLFLVGYWLYIDGVDTIVRMAGIWGISIGLDQQDIVLALLLTQFVGFPAALLFGTIGQSIGPRPAILICIAVYIIATIGAAFISSGRDFFVLAIVIGLVQGGVQALSRSYYARLIPEDKSGEFFGFYNMLGKFAAVLGPILMGLVALWTNNPRVSIVALALLFLAGACFLMLVDESKGREDAFGLEGI